MTGPQTGGLLDTVSRSPQRVWGHPNKHFCGAKMASVATLALLAANAFLDIWHKKASYYLSCFYRTLDCYIIIRYRQARGRK